MIAQDKLGGKAARDSKDVEALQDRVEQGAISALEGAAAPIINALNLNKSRRRALKVAPPEQIDMGSVWGGDHG